MLDTNAYFRLFNPVKDEFFNNLIALISVNGQKEFYISEVTSMEIHSVIGKLRRKSQQTLNKCEREILDGDTLKLKECSNQWIKKGHKRISRKLFQDIRKLISDMENCRGDCHVYVLPHDSYSIDTSKEFLLRYTDKYPLHSLDALICGSYAKYRRSSIPDLILMTSDKTIKAIMNEESLPVMDPVMI